MSFNAGVKLENNIWKSFMRLHCLDWLTCEMDITGRVLCCIQRVMWF